MVPLTINKFTSKYYINLMQKVNWLNGLMQSPEFNSQLNHAVTCYCLAKVGGHKGWIKCIKIQPVNKKEKKRIMLY